MWMDEAGIEYKVLPDVRIASIKAEIADRAELPGLFRELEAACGGAAAGDRILLLWTGTGLKGTLVEAALPVSREVRRGRVRTRILEGGPAYAHLHRGPVRGIEDHRAYVRRLYDQGIVPLGPLREVHLGADPRHPDSELVELQVRDHGWARRLARGVEAALGPEAGAVVVRGAQALGPAATSDERYAWARGAMERLDAATHDEAKKYLCVSVCADAFPPNRLEHLRGVYLRRRSVDDVLEDMRGDRFWYAGPVRKGAVVYETKLPFDEEGHKRARTREERRSCYCHCILLNRYINQEGMSPTYCHCGAGWYRQLWEAVTGAPVMIEPVRLLTKGDEECTFAVHLDPATVAFDLARDARRAEARRARRTRARGATRAAGAKKAKRPAPRRRAGGAKARPRVERATGARRAAGARKAPKRARARKRAR